MGPPEAVAHLTEVSEDVRAAVVFDGRGVLASTFDDPERARALASAAGELLASARNLRPTSDADVEHVAVSLGEASVYAVRADKRVVAAITRPRPNSTLVLYDLQTCLAESAAREPSAARVHSPDAPA